jgi:hypothetical protein
MRGSAEPNKKAIITISVTMSLVGHRMGVPKEHSGDSVTEGKAFH